MTPPLRIATVAGDPDVEARVMTGLAAGGSAEICLRCVDRVDLLAAIRSERIDGVVFAGAPGWLDAGTIAEAVEARLSLVGVAPDPIHRHFLESAGIVALAADVSPGDIVAALSRPNEDPPAAPEPEGRVVAVWGPKGAPGSTTIAISVAAAIARSEPRTLLVDADTYGGDVGQMVGIADDLPTIAWATRRAAAGDLTPAELATDLRRVGPEGPLLLSGIPRGVLWPDVSLRGWISLLEIAASTFAVTVCDVAASLETPLAAGAESEPRDGIARETLDRADAVVAVVRADPVGIKAFLWACADHRDLLDPERMIVVANHVDDAEVASLSALFSRHVGRPPHAFIPHLPHDAGEAMRRGCPLVSLRRSGPVQDAIQTVLQQLGVVPARRGLLTRLAGRA